jgi:orotidine-5'-phosphate decarboxylase
LKAAREAAGDSGPRVLGVTVLTSFGADEIHQAWGKDVRSVREEVTRLAALAVEAGLHGVVASPLEAEQIRRRHGSDLIIVTPGIRPSGDAVGDQVRTATPGDAARAGADFIVIGRPIIAASDPVEVIGRVMAELAKERAA